MTILKSVREVPNIASAILPSVLTESVRSSPRVSPNVDITVGEDVSTLPMLETVQPLTLVAVTILPLMDAVPFNFAVLPLSNV